MGQMKLNQEMKPLTYNSFMNILNFSQLYFQAMVQKQSPLYQLPGMNDSIVSKFNKKTKGEKSFQEILNTPELTEKLLSCYDDPQDLEKTKNYITLLPKVEFKIEIYVEEEGVKSKEIYAGDVMVIEMIVIDKSIPEGCDSHYMQSLYYPYIKYINWHAFILGRSAKGLTNIGEFRLVISDNKDKRREERV